MILILILFIAQCGCSGVFKFKENPLQQNFKSLQGCCRGTAMLVVFAQQNLNPEHFLAMTCQGRRKVICDGPAEG